MGCIAGERRTKKHKAFVMGNYVGCQLLFREERWGGVWVVAGGGGVLEAMICAC